jgi:acyl-homoserine-lactone acylase
MCLLERKRGLAMMSERAAGAAGNGPTQNVTIIRDTWGVPHIYAEDAASALFGLAYAQMEDQAVPILSQMRAAVGHAAETFGPDCLPSCLTQDETTHLFRVPQTAREQFPTLLDEERRRFSAFAAGINAYIAEYRAYLPAWVKPVAPADVVANVQWRSIMAQAHAASVKLGAGVDSASSGAPASSSPWAVSQPPPDPTASNMFALAPSRTATGGALFQSDLHLPYTGVHQWYEAHLVYGKTNVAGATSRSYPGISVGTNGHLAWSHTTNAVDEADVYQEQLNPANRDQYFTDGHYEDMRLETVIIKIRMPDGTLQEEEKLLRYTRHGPVILMTASYAYAAKVSLFGQIGLAGEFWQIIEAQNLEQFKEAHRRGQLPQYNVMAADRAGNIYYAAATRTGVRTPGYDYSRPVPGWIAATDWQGIVPFDRLPQAENPPRGYLQNANNAPWVTAPEQIHKDALPFYLRLGEDTPRSQRLQELLDPLQNATIADVQRIAGDDYVLIARKLKPIITRAVTEVAPDDQLAEAVGILNAWDNVASLNNTAMPLFTAWLAKLRALKPSFDVLQAPAPEQIVAADRAKVVAALREANAQLLQTYGRLDVRWGDVHKLARGDTVVEVSGGGIDEQTLHMNTCTRYEDGICYIGQGSSYMMIVDLASGRFCTTRPLGQSEDPASPHHADMTRLFAADQYKEFWMERSEVEAHQESIKVLPVSLIG